MKVNISIEYKTAWGESLTVVSNRENIPMNYCEGGFWRVTLPSVPEDRRYTFLVMKGDEILRREWRGHVLPVIPPDVRELDIKDKWNDRPSDTPFLSSFFTDVVFKRGGYAPRPASGNVTFAFFSPEIRPGQTIALAGGGAALGDWSRFTLLDDTSFPLWTLSLDVVSPFEYKFVVVDSSTLKPVAWEKGGNRVLSNVPGEGVHMIVSDRDPQFSLPAWRGAGTAVPVFSLRTEESFGSGDFHDLCLFADWAAETGQSVIQVLPLNDTTLTKTWRDSYPYNSVSAFALHPQYLYLPDAGVPVDEDYKKIRDCLNGLPSVDYERVNSEKERLLRKAYSTSPVPHTADYAAFVEDNSSWLLPYAVFHCLMDENGTLDFSEWGDYAEYDPAKAKAYADSHSAETGFYCFEQYLLDSQLKKAAEYAHSKGVALKGDLPIGVSRHGVDVWVHPDLFHVDEQAGAPPDDFSEDGQNWGFPTYNWGKMAEDGYSWWRRRFEKMNRYFDAFRIDHILGFFRIWEIPSEYSSGLMGHFSPALPYSSDELAFMGFDMSSGIYSCPPDGAPETDVLFIEDKLKRGYWHPRIAALSSKSFSVLPENLKKTFAALYEDFFYHRHESLWRESAMEKLPSLLDSSSMLPCGEDLGMIPSCVPDVMLSLGILSLEIQRMPKAYGVEFADTAKYPYYSVCATGTHDTSTLRAWWEEDPGRSGRFFHNILRENGEPPRHCEAWLCRKIVQQHLLSPSMLAILPLQDWLSVDEKLRYHGDPKDERINVPSNPDNCWKYRMHLKIEDLLADKAFTELLKNLVLDSGRNC